MNKGLTIADAIGIASAWIEGSGLEFRAAFIGGSTAYAAPDEPYDPASDIDCYLVISGDPPEGKIGKTSVKGALLDVSWLPWHQLEGAESHAVLAGLLHFGKIVADRDCELTRLKEAISSRFGTPENIAIRLEDMRNRVSVIASDNRQLPEPEMVMNWLFPATLATHIPLVAACAPLTVRKRFIAAKRVMHPNEYETLLSLYGFAEITPDDARTWLDNTEKVFDHAAPIAEDSHRFWAGDIKEDARAIAIDGSRQLIESGFHREALYWIIATQTRCLTVLNDANIDTSPFMPAFEAMVSRLKIGSREQRAERSSLILQWISEYKHRS